MAFLRRDCGVGIRTCLCTLPREAVPAVELGVLTPADGLATVGHVICPERGWVTGECW